MARKKSVRTESVILEEMKQYEYGSDKHRALYHELYMMRMEKTINERDSMV